VVSDIWSQWPQKVEFQLSNARCNLLDHLPEGSVVEVQYNLRGRQYTNQGGETKTFNTLEAIKVERIQVT
jgi:hypothetical protein